AAIIVPSSASPVGAPNALDRSALGPNLIKNSGFKYGFKNWAKPKQDALAIVPGGVWGTQQAAAMKARKSTTSYQLRDDRSTAPKSVKGRKYQASAWVRSTGHPIHGTFELLEWKDKAVVAQSG